MRRVFSILVSVACLSACAAPAPSPVCLTIDTRTSGLATSPDFGVFSFETVSLQYGSKNYNPDGYFFSPTNTQLIALFHNLGVKSLRIGGDSVDANYIPSTRDIDSFFGFARVAGIKVIYSLDLAGGKPDQAADAAKYIWRHYRTNVICLAIGNEPDEYKVNGQSRAITNFPTFMRAWKSFASAVTSAVPDVKIGGPDNDGKTFSWDSRFAQAERGSANVSCLLYHYKPLKSAKGKTDEELIAGELSSELDASNYPSCYHEIGGVAQDYGLPYRFTEFTDFVAPARTGLRDYSFAAALFALDALHWWSAHGCLGVCFHTGIHGFHADFFVDPKADYQLYPISYGIAAFDAGGFGNVMPLTMTDPDGLNLTAYAVRNDANLYVTIINKEYGANARGAVITINANGFATGSVAAMFLVQTNGDAMATDGVMLGGASISGAGPWVGQWTPVGTLANGQCSVKVPAVSAVVLRISGYSIARQPSGLVASGQDR